MQKPNNQNSKLSYQWDELLYEPSICIFADNWPLQFQGPPKSRDWRELECLIDNIVTPIQGLALSTLEPDKKFHKRKKLFDAYLGYSLLIFVFLPKIPKKGTFIFIFNHLTHKLLFIQFLCIICKQTWKFTLMDCIDCRHSGKSCI